MVFDILLGRTRWELYQIIGHYEKESKTNEIDEENPENFNLLLDLNERAKKDPINEYAYKLLAKKVKEVHGEIQIDEQKVRKDLDNVRA